MTDETLAAILAEMRASCGDVADHEVAAYADRIESAAKRLSDAKYCEGWDNCEVTIKAEQKQSDPGNAAALRETLEKIRREYCDGLISCQTCVSSDADVERVSRLFYEEIDAALAAPARNADRFATVGAAHKAWRATSQECDFCDWLFEKAKETEAAP